MCVSERGERARIVRLAAVALEDLLERRDALAGEPRPEPAAGFAALDLRQRLGLDGSRAVLGRAAVGVVLLTVFRARTVTVGCWLELLATLGALAGKAMLHFS